MDPPTLVMTGATTTKLVAAGTSDTFTLTVTDIFGAPVEGAQVSGGFATGVTDVNGLVSLQAMAGARINNLTFVAWDDDGRSGSVQLGTYGATGVLGLSSLAVNDTTPVQGMPVTISATVANTGLVAATFVVDLRVDGATVAQKSVTVNAGQTAPVSFTWVFTDTAAHQVTIGSLTAVSVTASAPTTGGGGTVVQGLDTTLAIGLAVGLLIVGVVVGMLLGRRGGGSRPASMASMKAESPSEEAPAEEELPPEL